MSLHSEVARRLALVLQEYVAHSGCLSSLLRRRLHELLRQRFGDRCASSRSPLVALRAWVTDCVDAANAAMLILLVNQALALAAPNIHTRDKFFTELRQSLSTCRTAAEWKELQSLVIVDRCVRAAKKLHTQRQVAVKNHHMKVWRLDELLTAMQSLASDSSVVAHIALALLCCGSRLIEVLHLSSFAILAQQSSSVLVRGLAKRAGDRSVVRPVWHTTPQLLVRSISEIQRQVREECVRLHLHTNAAITNRYCAAVNAKLQQYLPTATTRSCRGIYVRATFYLYAPQQESEAGWVATVLGHKSGLLHAAHHYTGCEIPRNDKTVADAHRTFSDDDTDCCGSG